MFLPKLFERSSQAADFGSQRRNILSSMGNELQVSRLKILIE